MSFCHLFAPVRFGAALASAAWLAIGFSSLQAAPFTPGSIVVSQVGGNTTNNNANPLAILEYTTSGSLIQTISQPSTTGDPNILTNKYSNNVQSVINVNAGYVTQAGFNTTVGNVIPGGAPTDAISQPYGLDGTIANRTAFAGKTGVNNTEPNVVLPTSATTFYAGANSGGVQYFNGSSFTTLSNIGGVRNIKVFGGDLYANSTTGILYKYAGLPTTSGQTPTSVLTGLGSTVYAFVMFDTNGDTTLDRLYMADERNNNAAGGLNRWDLIGDTWTNQYSLRFNTGNSLSAAAGSGIRGLTGTWDAATSTASLFATTSDSTTRLVSVLDTGVAPTTYGLLATAGTGLAFKSVDVIAVPEPTSLTLLAACGGAAGLAGVTRLRRRSSC
jgi:hypothetical protein